MSPHASPDAVIAYLKHLATQNPTGAIDEAMRLNVWTPGSVWHREDVLAASAQLAVDVDEYRLAGLAAYQAQHLHLAARSEEDAWGLPDLPALEVAARRFNLVRYIPLAGRNIQLRQPRLSDQDFLLRMFLDPGFVRQYCRPVVGHEEMRVHRLIKWDRLVPQWDTPWAWIIADRSGRPLGLLELNSVNFKSGNVDLAMGLYQPGFSTVALEAFSLGMCIAFHHLGMKRVTGRVYSDNSISHRLHRHMGSVHEYTLDGFVSDPESGAPIPATLYSMTLDEARASPWAGRIGRFLEKSGPDLMIDQLEQLSESIVSRGPRWKIFPPEVLPAVPPPPAVPEQLTPSMPPPRARIEGTRVILRFPVPEDQEVLRAWFDHADFMKVYPDAFDPEAGLDALRDRLGGGPGKLLVWLVEDKQRQCLVGLVGIEIVNNLPLLFGFSGFAVEASTKQVVESWALLRKALRASYPHAKLYLKVPQGSVWCSILERARAFESRGFERNQPGVGKAGFEQLALFEPVSW